MLRKTESTVDLLILGAGWTSTFLIPLLKTHSITHAATTRSGSNNTIPFTFNPDSTDTTPYTRLPSAKTILITFPLTGTGQSKLLTSLYRQVHGANNFWIQLGTTGIFDVNTDWANETSPYNTTHPRAVAEDELLACVPAAVLNLCGLWGGTRVPKNWVPRIAKTKDDVKARKSVHFVHGEDVARAIVGAHLKRERVGGKRWIVTDLRVYDWWDLILSFSSLTGEEGEEVVAERQKFAVWVEELMREEGVRALPREMGVLGRKLDGRNFWREIGGWPGHKRLA
jgi:hypothetical protein